MNNFFLLLKREFLIFIDNINFYILVLFLFPSALFLFLGTPLLSIIKLQSGMSYSYKLFTAIFYVSTTFISFIIPLLIINRENNNNYFYKILKINHLIYSVYILLFSVIIAYLQFIVSFFLSLSLLDILGISRFLFFLLSIFPSILLFSCLGQLCSNFLLQNKTIVFFSVFLFMYITFAIGTFIPMSYFSKSYQNMNELYNIVFYLQDLFVLNLEGQPINMGAPIIGIFISMILFSIHISLLNKKRK